MSFLCFFFSVRTVTGTAGFTVDAGVRLRGMRMSGEVVEGGGEGLEEVVREGLPKSGGRGLALKRW